MNGKEILEKIKEGHIKPKPKWEFLLKNSVIWLIFVAAIFIGSLATSVIIFMLTHTDWQYYAAFGGPLKLLLVNLPYFWLVTLIIFIGIAFYEIKHAKKGYRYNSLVIVLVSVIISLIIGSAVYAIGAGEKLEELIYRRVPIYQLMMHQRGRMFLAPERGMIAGVVIEVNEDSIIIRDFRGQTWNIATSTDQFEVGQRVHLIGRLLENHNFDANLIKPGFRPGPKFLPFFNLSSPR